MFAIHAKRIILAAVALGMLSVPGVELAHAAPGDPDYETVSAPASSVNPPGFANSPLAVPDNPAGPHAKMRFVMRDGTIIIGQVLAFDGQMYALWIPHGTMLARKDLFVSITPVPGEASAKPLRSSHPHKVHVS